jgi:hypothetical protein
LGKIFDPPLLFGIVMLLFSLLWSANEHNTKNNNNNEKQWKQYLRIPTKYEQTEKISNYFAKNEQY